MTKGLQNEHIDFAFYTEIISIHLPFKHDEQILQV